MRVMAEPGFDLDRIGGRAALRELVDEVLACGAEALRLQRAGAGARAERKADKSPVTEADKLVETRLRALIARRFPGASVLGEEQGGSMELARGARFVIDPIDGTRAFVRDLPGWSVLVGIEWDGEPVVGIAHLPATGGIYVAVKGDGASGNGKPLRLSSVGSLEEAVVSHGALHQFTDAGLVGLLAALGARTYTQRGYADFEQYRYLLEGRIDAVVDPDMEPWDLIAPAVIVREAGGLFTSIEGEHSVYAGSGLAANPALHAKLLGVARDAAAGARPG